MKRMQMRLAVACVVVLGLLGAGGVQAALVTISSVETWDGVSNPHAASGVTLTTNTTVTPNVFIYTIPDGMHITATGELRPGNVNITLSFAEGGGGLQIDAGGNVSPEVWPNVRWHGGGSPKRNLTTNFTFDMNGNDITGAGTINGKEGGSENWAYHHVIIKQAGDVTLSSVIMEQHDATMGDFVVAATGTVSIGSINVRGTGGGHTGDIYLRAPNLTVGDILATSTVTDLPGYIRLEALAAPYYGQRAWEHNTTANTLTLNGTITTRAGMSLVAAGVELELGPGFSTNRDTDRSVTLRHGRGGTFTDNSTEGDYASAADVWHQESPPPGAKPQLIVNASETWNGTDNPRAADGVTLAAGVYTLPGDLYIVAPATVTFRNRVFREHFTLPAKLQTGGFAPLRFGDADNVSLVFTNGSFRLGTDVELYLTVGRNSSRTLTVDLGGGDLDGGSSWLAGGGWTNAGGAVGARRVTITNAADIVLGAITTVSHSSVHHPINVYASGAVAIGRLHTRSTDTHSGKDITVQAGSIAVDEIWSMGRTGGGNVTLRAEQVDIGRVVSWAQDSGAAGNILLEALKAPQFDPALPVHTVEHALTVRGLLDTAVATARSEGNITLRGGLVKLESGFELDLNENGTFAIFAGEGDPATYFVNNSSEGPFTPTFNVKLQPPFGTVIWIR